MRPLPAISREQVRDIDRRAIEFGLPGRVLMENAGRGIADLLIERGVHGPVVLCCGRGNNGGDGFVTARHLEAAGVDVEVLLFTDPLELTGDAASNLAVLRRAQTPLTTALDLTPAEWAATLQSADWIVDALLGTGLTGEVRAPYDAVIETINSAGRPVLAVDLPTGMDCDTGRPLGECVQAEVTATFVARKLGFEAAGTERLTGEVVVLPIGVPRLLLSSYGEPTHPQ
jgi:NAD(P)H-hydrate epimerase